MHFLTSTAGPRAVPTQEGPKNLPLFQAQQGQRAAEMAAPAALSPPHASVGSKKAVRKVEICIANYHPIDFH